MPGDLPDAAQIVTLTWAPDGRAVYASDPRVRIPFSATEALTAVHADDEEWIVYPDVSASGVAQAALRSAALRGANGRLNQHPRSLRRCWPRPFWSAP